MDVPLWRRVICREIVDISIDKQQLACLSIVKDRLPVAALWTSRLLWPVLVMKKLSSRLHIYID